MSDRDQITDLIYRYAELIDDGDFAGVGELLGRAELTFEGYTTAVTGAEAVAGLYTSTTRRFDDGTPATKHVMTNVIVEVDGEQASSRSYFTVLQAVPGELGLQPVIAGRYRDRFIRENDTWRFSAMHVIVDLVGDLSSHLLTEI
jgi:3-phenylpropionate/cinnamic acid dioxygenase small subunit